MSNIGVGMSAADEDLGSTTGGEAPNAGGFDAGQGPQEMSATAPASGVQAAPQPAIEQQPAPPPTPQMGVDATPPSQKAGPGYLEAALGAIHRGANKSAKAVAAASLDETDANRAAGDAALTEGTEKQGILDHFMQNEVPGFMDRMANIDKTFQENVAKAQAKTEDQMKKVLQASAAAQDFQFHDYWADKTDAGKVIGIIAQALGGAANGLAGQPGAPTAMDRIIDRNMELQKAQYNKLKGDVDAAQGAYAMFRQQLGDEISVNTAMRTAMNQKLQQQVDIMAQQMGVPQAAAATVKAQLMARNAQSQAESARALANVYTNEAHAASGVYTEMAREKNALQMAAMKAMGKSGAHDQKVAAKQSDVDLAIGRIDEALKAPHLSPADQRMLAESYAQALQNSTMRGPRKDEREVQQAQVSGTLFPNFHSVNLNELATTVRGMDKDTLRRMRAELIQKQRRREGGIETMDGDNSGDNDQER